MFPYVSVGPGVNAGTTATVALLRDGIELVVGSVGDSRAMLCRKGKALKLTVDHTPERKDEKERYVDVNAKFVRYKARYINGSTASTSRDRKGTEFPRNVYKFDV